MNLMVFTIMEKAPKVDRLTGKRILTKQSGCQYNLFVAFPIFLLLIMFQCLFKHSVLTLNIFLIQM